MCARFSKQFQTVLQPMTGSFSHGMEDLLLPDEDVIAEVQIFFLTAFQAIFFHFKQSTSKVLLNWEN